MDVRRRGGRPGPRTRAVAEAVAIEEQQQQQQWRERQRRSRAAQAAANEAVDGGNQRGDADVHQALRWGTRRHRTSIWRRSQRIADSLIHLLERVRDPCIRAAVLDKVFTNQRVRPLLPNYYPSPIEARAQRHILQNIRSDLRALKVPHSSGMLARKRAILEAAVSELDSDILNFHNILCTRKENLVAAVERLRSAATVTSSRYPIPVRKKREGGISEEVKAAVILWWIEETRVTPRRRDVRRKRLDRSLYDTHAAHLLLEGQMQLYNRFVDAFPHFSIQCRTFFKLRPFFVIKCKERNVCCCRYHIQVLFLLEALNAFRDLHRGAHVLFICTCQCIVCDIDNDGVCNVGSSRYAGVTALCDDLLCPKLEGEEFHQQKCLMGACSRCSVRFFKVCPREQVVHATRSIQWKQFQYETVGTSADGRPKKRIKEVLLTTSFSEFLDFFSPTMEQFIRHNFIAKWQSEQAKLLQSCLQGGAILTHIDFSKKYTFKAQNEIKSMYYHSDQISILVQVTYCTDVAENSSEDGKPLKRETHFYISDDKTHDTFFAQHYFMLHWRWMQSRGQSPQIHYVFSDGCAGQFKGAKAMYFVSRYPLLTAGCKMLWSYYGTGHGKGEWDGARAVIKRALRSEQLLNPHRRLQNAADCVLFLDATMAGQVPSRSGGMRSYRYFHHIGVNDVDRSAPETCDPIPGSSKFHSIFGFDKHDPTKLLVRGLSCFCGPCLEEDFVHCEKKAYVKPWTVFKIQPRNVQYAAMHMTQEEDEESWDYEYDIDCMADLVQQGDNFAVVASDNNAEGISYYILQCQTPKQIVENDFDCVWGGHFQAGDYVICGTYYQKWGRRDSNNYVYLRSSRPAYVDCTSVLACKFQMIPRQHRVKGGDAVYSLSEETVDVINTALEELQADL